MRKIERQPNGSGIFCPGQDLVAAGTIGKMGVEAAINIGKDRLLTRFTEDFIREALAQTKQKQNLTPEFLEAMGASEWEYVEEGGFYAALWNISGAYEQGISVEILKIPVNQEMIEVCEFFDLNPYRLMSGGCYVAAADNGQDLVRALNAQGIEAAVIGKVEKGIARKMIGPGGTGFLERPQPDELYKITGTQREQEEQHA